MTRYRALSLAAFREVFRDRVGIFFTFAFPLVFLVIFGLLYGKESVGSRHYIDFIAPGVLCWAIGNGALFGVAHTLMYWRKSKVLQVIRMTPTNVPTVLGARYLVAIGVGVAQAVLFVLVALLPPFGLHLGSAALLALPVLVLGLTAFFALGLLLGTYANSSESIAAIANSVMVPMAFLSGAFIPLEATPGWVRAVSHALPLRYMIEGAGGVLSGYKGASSILMPCLILAGFTVVVVLFATRLFRWGSEA